MALGLSLGQIDREVVSLVTMVGLITIALSTYMILYSRPLYAWLAPFLGVFERKNPRPEQSRDEHPLDALVVGLGRYGSQVVERLQADGRTIAAVDFDPASLRTWGNRLEVLYGDAEDPEFVANLPLREARSVIATMPDVEVTRTLLHGLRSAGFQGPVVLTAHTQANADRLQDADHRGLVVVPFAQGVEPVAQLVAQAAAAPLPDNAD